MAKIAPHDAQISSKFVLAVRKSLLNDAETVKNDNLAFLAGIDKAAIL